MAIRPGDVAPVLVTSVLALATAATIVLRGPLGRALARRIEGSAAQPEPDGRLEQLEHQP